MTTPSPSANFLDTAIRLLQETRAAEETVVAEAAARLADAVEDDRLIHVFGVGGHSVLGCEEFFYRAGGLACINPLFDLSLLLAGGGVKSTLLERTPGVGSKVVISHELAQGDVLIITSIYGMNAATLDAALEAKSRQATVIAITSVDHATTTPRDFPARHPSRQNLYEVADLVIDNHVPHGDAVVDITGVTTKMGSVSTILVSFCVQWLVMETAALLVRRGRPAPVWQSANVPGGDAYNKDLLARYLPRVKSL